MNEQPNTQPPKKSFWAKLFGGKDNNTTQATTVPTTPAVVPPTDPGQPLSDSVLPATPPASQFSTVSETPVSVPEQIATPPVASTPSVDGIVPPAAASEPAVTPSADVQMGIPSPLSTVEFNETSPFSTDQTTPQPVQEESIAPPPSDPMVTPVAQVPVFDQAPVAPIVEPLPNTDPYTSPVVPGDDSQTPPATPAV